MSNLKKNNGKMFICDPVCVFPYGHNVSAMDNFRKLMHQYYDEIVCVGNKYLPGDVSKNLNINRFFNYYYNNSMPLSDECNKIHLPEDHESKVEAAKIDLQELLINYSVDGGDVLCYPSIDFYSIIALIESIELIINIGNPKILIRFIGVMETASSINYSKPMLVMIAMINKLFDSGLRLKLAAETPRYAEKLAVSFERVVSVLANIEHRDFVDLPRVGEFNVICPGSARYDKGFLLLHELFSKVRENDVNYRIKFHTQVLPDRDLKDQLNYLVKLYSIPGVNLLPSHLPADELISLYQNSDLVLLPYARDVYEYRGSAVLIEAICTGRHCISLDGPAFVEQMNFFSAGTVCHSVEEMAEKILDFSRQSAAMRSVRAIQARTRFVRDLETSYKDWIL